MQKALINKVDEAIDAALQNQIELLGGGWEVITLMGEFIEYFYVNGKFFQGENLRPALDILIPILIKNTEKAELSHDYKSQLEKIKDITLFAGHYYSIRDLIYYSYALPESIIWKNENSEIEIQVLDKTIFRQLASEIQSFGINSSTSFKHISKSNTESLLHGTNSWDMANPNVNKAFEIISEEAEVKIRYFFSYINSDSTIDIGGYKYSDFIKVYKVLLIISLYERYYSSANKISSVITYNVEEISKQLSQETKIDGFVVQKILKDISTSSRGTFILNSDEKKYYLLPSSFSLKDSIGAILKQFAKRDSDSFSAECGILIGDKLVSDIESFFSRFRNFRVYKDVQLQQFGKHLPDIDIAAISYEPSLGFHFYVCEVKNSLPATWAKDHLKSIGKKGYIEKAISQIKKLKKFFDNSEGHEFFKNLIFQAFPDLNFNEVFPGGFMLIVDYLIITDQNNGIFYPDLNLNIISKDLLREIVCKSDGDVNYIKYYIQNINTMLDQTYEVNVQKITIGDITISYDSPIINGFISFPQNEYLSNGTLEELEKTAKELGYNFINSISAKTDIESDLDNT